LQTESLIGFCKFINTAPSPRLVVLLMSYIFSLHCTSLSPKI
jgi:hypothetical protein